VARHRSFLVGGPCLDIASGLHTNPFHAFLLNKSATPLVARHSIKINDQIKWLHPTLPHLVMQVLCNRSP
jgi:hypothetical protein